MKKILINEVGECCKIHSFMDLRDPLKEKGFKVDYYGELCPHYIIKKKHMEFLICNKKYADDEEKIFGEIAVGEM